MNEIEFCWKDLASAANCCPALHEAPGVYLVTGERATEEVREQLAHLDNHEEVVVTPRNVIDLLVFDANFRRELSFASTDYASRYERISSHYMPSWASDMVELAEIRPGETVLDLACGTGFVARQIQAVFGSRVTTVGVDSDAAMLFEASRHGALADAVRCEASNVPLPTDAFDVILCQQGLQYFTRPRASMAEAFRLLRSGGRLAFSVWGSSDENEFLASQVMCVEPYLRGVTVAEILGRNIVSLGGPAGVRSLLEQAGFNDVKTEWRQMNLELPNYERYIADLVEYASWSTLFHGALSTDQQDEVVRGLLDSLVWNAESPIANMSSLTFSCRKQ